MSTKYSPFADTGIEDLPIRPPEPLGGPKYYEWLVEERTSGEIPFHAVVVALSVELAFNFARTHAKKGGRHFQLSTDDIFESIRGYLWQVADGSDTWYEIRKLKEAPEWTRPGLVS